MNNDEINFRQSVNDFPVLVSLGKKNPAWKLSRWRGNNGLRFVPNNDEGFTLRGDRKRLVYKGRRRSHRFTILNDGAFEYDCILLREPESNIIALRMEGAERFDFFRQPDFVPDPFLKGSYAVYKKETLVGEGTGKLCHIHRPLIIDARGRKIWGELSVAKNELHITMPEQWLAQAAYPVVIDPVIGTTTVGSQNKWEMYEGEPFEPLMFELAIPVNRFLVPETINGLCTAYTYVNQDDGDAGGRPVFYSDNGNKPLTRKSTEEGFIDLRVTGGKPAGWRSATFKSNGSIASGSYIWFGVFCEYYWLPRFDWGTKCYADMWDTYDSIPNTYPTTKWTEIYDFKLSMYFTYTSAQNYVRTLTQGVKLTDTRKRTSSFKRNLYQNISVNSGIKRIETFIRKCVMTARTTMYVNRFPNYFRKAAEQIKISSDESIMRSLIRRCSEMITVQFGMKRIQGVLRSIYENVKSNDSQHYSVLFIRCVDDKTVLYETTKRTAEYIKILETKADTADEISHIADYHRLNKDKVQAEGLLFRGLILFVKIVTGVFIRDYIIRRFLKAQEELKLKSCISRELFLNSNII